MRALFAPAVVAALLAHAAPGAAAPCECIGYANLPVIAPLKDTPLPTNGKLLMRDGFIEPKVFRNTPDGEEIPTHLELAGGNFVWLVLEQELNPATQYKLTTSEGELTTFNAFSGPDTEPPLVSGVRQESSRVSGPCFDVERVVLRLFDAADETGLSLTVKLEVDTPKEESVVFFSDRDVSFVSADVSSPCFVKVPDTEQGKKYGATVTVYDRSGNAAQAIGVKLDFPMQPVEDDGGCGCRTAPSPSRLPVPVLLALGTLALRRRRHGVRSCRR